MININLLQRRKILSLHTTNYAIYAIYAIYVNRVIDVIDVIGDR